MEFNSLKYYRKKHGLTQEQIAERLGVSRQAVAKWERGETAPDLNNVIALADMYEVTVDHLVRNLSAERFDGEADNPEGRKHIFGYSKLNDKGQLTLPKKCREVFDLKAGDAILILGDEDKGIALVKLSSEN